MHIKRNVHYKIEIIINIIFSYGYNSKKCYSITRKLQGIESHLIILFFLMTNYVPYLL